MKRTRLLLLTGIMVNFVIVALATQVGNLSNETVALKARQERDQARLKAAIELAERAVDEASVANPAQAADLKVQLRIVRSGDLRLLDPAKHKDFNRLFDEML